MAQDSKQKFNDTPDGFMDKCDVYFRSYEGEQGQKQKWFVRSYIAKFLDLGRLDQLWRYLVEVCPMRYTPDIHYLKKATEAAAKDGLILWKPTNVVQPKRESVPEEERVSEDEVEQLFTDLVKNKPEIGQETRKMPLILDDHGSSEDDIPF